jgi:hypothetical protein
MRDMTRNVSKRTLKVDDQVLGIAKRYAAARCTSVSRIVERYLELLAKPPRVDDRTPVLRMLRGAARDVPAEAYRRHPLRKHR